LEEEVSNLVAHDFTSGFRIPPAAEGRTGLA
jgi:hypothetical protein